MLRYLILVLCGLFWWNDGYAHNREKIDSLVHVLEGQTGGERFWPLYHLAFEYINGDNHKALEIIQQAEKAAFLRGDSLLIIKSKRVRGTILSLLHKPDEAIACVLPLIKIPNLKDFGDEYLMAMNVAAGCYSLIGQFDKALDSQFLLLEEARARNDEEFVSLSTRNIGFVYYKLKDYKKSIYFINKSLELKYSLPAHYQSPMNLSLSYAHLGSFDSARIALDESIGNCGGNCPPEALLHIAYASGNIYYGLGQVENAKHEFLKSLNLARKVEDERMQLDNIYLLAKIYMQEKKLTLAEEYLRSGEAVIESGIPFNMEVMKVYAQLAELYRIMKDYRRAVSYQSRYIKLKDSLYNEAVTNRLMEIESKHLELENESTIAEQEKAIIQSQELIQRKNKLNILSALVVFLTIVIIIFLFRTYRKKQALNALLERKVRERTLELELSRRELLRDSRQREVAIKRASSHIFEKINTLKGLCLAAREGISDPAAPEYLDRMNSTSKQIEEFVGSVLTARQ